MGHSIVINIWKIDACQRQNYLTPAVSCYFMSLSDKASYLPDSIMLLLQIIATMLSTVKFERSNLPFTTEDIIKGELNWSMHEITPPCYVINICILYRLYFNKMSFFRKSLLDAPMQIFIKLRHLFAEISRFKFDDCRVIRTGASDRKLFWAVYIYIYIYIINNFIQSLFQIMWRQLANSITTPLIMYCFVVRVLWY